MHAVRRRQGGPALTISGGSGESHRLVPTQQAGVGQDDKTPRFDPQTDVSGNSITLPYDLSSSVSTGDPLVYSSGGGAPIGGLVDGGTYYVIGSGTHGPFQLAATRCEAVGFGADSSCKDENGNPIAVTPIVLDASQATGKSHSLVKQGDMVGGDASAFGPRQIVNQTETGFHGVAVTATNSDDIAAVGASVGVGGSAGVGGRRHRRRHHRDDDRDDRQEHDDQRPDPAARRTRASRCSSRPPISSTCSSIAAAIGAGTRRRRRRRDRRHHRPHDDVEDRRRRERPRGEGLRRRRDAAPRR